MRLDFPAGFFWGTSTAAAQIETASDHNWKGFAAKDGFVFERTADHELRRDEDIDIIAQFGKVYRCGVDWARLQKKAYGDFDVAVIKEYSTFFQKLNERGIKIMFVIHHFTHPIWFEQKNAFLGAENIPIFMDYAKKCIHHFKDYVFNWNTFNEPNVYCLNAYITGNFPPQKNNIFKGTRALKNMAKAHDELYTFLKQETPNKEVGISLNTALFEGLNLLGRFIASFTDWWFVKQAAELFKKVDYLGISYYAHILFKPGAITEIDQPGKLAEMGYPHDGMWAYKPEGLGFNIQRLYDKYKKPVIITENGICSSDPQARIQCLKDYLSIIHRLIEKGVDIKGYIHWSTFDNFEWNLGPTFQFGLASVDLETRDRTITDAGRYYNAICESNSIEV